jgi:RNA polymerase sigma factor (sigma-70 family)
MPSAPLARLVTRCRGLSAPDAELLRRFARSRDADAFAELLARHADLVWGVCRRTLPQEADAEDAFQAVFLALARGARSVDPRRPLGAWLHAVAVRVARRALGKTLRRRTADLPECPGPADVPGDVSSRDLFRAVDEEIERLPAALRGPVVLCCLEGRARDEAAEALGCTVPAVKARLERGRQALRRALARRGIALPVAFFVLGVGASRVGAGLRERAVRAALGSPSPAVAALAAAAPVPFGLMGVALAAAVAVGVGAFGLGQGPPKDPPASDSRSESPTLPAGSASGSVDRFGDPLPDGAVRRFGTVRFRHDMIEDLAFTSDGKRLIAGVRRTTLAVIDPADGRKLGQVGPMDSNYNDGFALSPDGKRVYCIGSRLIEWDLATGAKVRQFEAVQCQSVAVSPDGKKVAAAREVDRETQGGSAMIFDAATGEKLVDLHQKDLPAHQPGLDVRHMAFSPDGKMVAAVAKSGRGLPIGVRLWEAATGKPLATIAPAGDVPHTFAFIPGSKLIACLGSEGVIHLWDTEAGQFSRTIPMPKDDDDLPVVDLQVSADGKRAAGVYLRRGIVVVFDPKTGKELRRLTPGGTTTGDRALALSPDGALVACRGLGGDSAVRVWEVDSGNERLADAGHRGPATLSLSADGKTLISRGAGQVFHWNLATGEGQARPDDVKDPDGQVPTWTSTAAYRAGRYRIEMDWMEYGPEQIVVRTRDGSKLIAKTSCPKDPIVAVAHSPDGRTVALPFQNGRGFTILLWSPETQAEPFRLTGHPDSYQEMTFTHDGKYLIAGAGTSGNAYRTETVFIYETATGKLVRKLATHRATGHLLVTADDRTLITGQWDDATAKVWDLATGKELAVLVDPGAKVPPRPRGSEMASIAGLALSADERFLAVLTEKGDSSSVSVWDTGLWKPIRFRSFAPIPTRSSIITSQTSTPSLVFSRDGRSVFVAYPDSTILEWQVAGRSTGPTPTAGRLAELWQTLGDAEKGYAAAWELLDRPAEAVALFKTKLTPAAPIDAAAVKELVRKLGADSFREREEAGQKLVALGEGVLPVVREMVAGDLPAETRERAAKVIAALSGGLTPEQLRQRRAVAVLEWTEWGEADELLRKLAGGDPASRQTKEARAALERRGR